MDGEDDFKEDTDLSDGPKDDDILGDDVVGLGDDEEEAPDLGDLNDDEDF